MNFLHLTKDKLDLGAISDLVTHESCGAVSFFVGTTRDNFEDKKACSITFDIRMYAMNDIFYSFVGWI